MGQLKNYKFNVSKARQTVILFIGSSLLLIFLIAVTENKISDLIENKIIIFVFGMLYGGVLMLFIKRLYNSFSSELSICINENEIFIPTYYLGRKIIIKNEIYSVEKLYLKNKIVGASLGLRNKGAYVIDKHSFKNPDEFQQVYDHIKNYINDSAGIEKSLMFDSLIEKRKKNKAFLSYIVSLLSIIFYFIGTSGGIEYSENIGFLLIGANTNETLSLSGLYRITSSTFLHISIFHLLLNLLMLGIFSQFLEKSLGYIRFSNLFFLSSTIAVLISALFSDFDASIGASGGIFGLWGAYTLLKVKFEKNLPGSINTIPTKRFYFVLLIELFIEVFVIENIDIYNHIGGFICGFLYLYFIPLGLKLETIDQPTIYEKYLFGILVSCYAFGLSYFLLLYYGLT